MFRTTPDFIRYVKQVTGKDLRWFFDVYLYQAALPQLVQTRSGDQLTLALARRRAASPSRSRSRSRSRRPSRRSPMTGGTGTHHGRRDAHVVVDPMSRVLKQDDDVDAYQAWRAAQAKGDAK